MIYPDMVTFRQPLLSVFSFFISFAKIKFALFFKMARTVAGEEKEKNKRKKERMNDERKKLLNFSTLRLAIALPCHPQPRSSGRCRHRHSPQQGQRNPITRASSPWHNHAHRAWRVSVLPIHAQSMLACSGFAQPQHQLSIRRRQCSQGGKGMCQVFRVHERIGQGSETEVGGREAVAAQVLALSLLQRLGDALKGLHTGLLRLGGAVGVDTQSTFDCTGNATSLAAHQHALDGAVAACLQNRACCFLARQEVEVRKHTGVRAHHRVHVLHPAINFTARQGFGKQQLLQLGVLRLQIFQNVRGLPHDPAVGSTQNRCH
eukprot:m.129320 g.129320  ORF g.129320 m.129320 type:complete len:318 (+) comp19939_c2_seq2:276-1229(+)